MELLHDSGPAGAGPELVVMRVLVVAVDRNRLARLKSRRRSGHSHGRQSKEHDEAKRDAEVRGRQEPAECDRGPIGLSRGSEHGREVKRVNGEGGGSRPPCSLAWFLG